MYYFNGETGESLWEKPTPTFPDVQLMGSMRKQATEKQQEYLKSLDAEEKGKKGFFRTILEAADTTEETAKQEKSGAPDSKDTTTKEVEWFSLFDQPKTEVEETKPVKEEEKRTKQEEKPSEDTFFANIFSSPPKTEEKKEENFFDNLFNKPKAEDPVSQKKVNGSAATAKAEVKVAEKVVKEKVEEVVIAPPKVEAASFVLPHPAKMFWGGEDAVMTKGRTFGVFDGVSGADKIDGMPLYSKTLADELKKVVDKKEGHSVQELTRLLTQCAEWADEHATGASTAVVASIGSDGFLRALNVGDSTCIIVRDGKVASKTREISHYFDCPYQLSADSPDRPRDGTKMNVELVRGDIVVMGSDGVFDNVEDGQVAAVVTQETQLSKMAKRISELSRRVSLDRKAPTPYAKQAKRFGDPDFSEGLGGKVDDVSCVVVSYK